MKIFPIDDIDHPNLQPYKTLRRPMDHQRQGIFVAEGEKVVRRLLESRLTVISILLTAEWLEAYRPLLVSQPTEVQVFVAQKSVLESIVGFHLHQGIMAVARIPTPLTLRDAVEQSRRPLLLVAVDSLTNAENLGVLVRNCAAFSVDALLVGETSSSPYLRRAVRNSMGTVFNLPIVHCTSLVGAIGDMQSTYNVWVIAAHPHAIKRVLGCARLERDCCIVFGSEGEGVSAGVLDACDESVAIPMANGVDSLNVASASAVFLYEVQRQRGTLRFWGERR